MRRIKTENPIADNLLYGKKATAIINRISNDHQVRERFPHYHSASLLQTDNEKGVTCGKIEGGVFDVTFDGAATYRLPLWVPQGRLGIQPELSLQYHSRSGNGLLGVGWSLNGLSQISIGKSTFPDDKKIEPVKFDQTDHYYLDGQRLYLVRGLHGKEGAEYRTKQDVFAKIVIHDVDELGPTWFEVFMKDGRICKYGDIGDNHSGARFEGNAISNSIYPGSWPPGSQDKNDVTNDQLLRDASALDSFGSHDTLVRFGWAISSMRDRSGNEMLYYYDYFLSSDGIPGIDRDYLPVKISYTLSSVDKIAPLRMVEFIWEDRKDVELRFISGLRLSQKKRLSEIRMSGPDSINTELLRTYSLQYRNDSVSSRSLLSTVTELDQTGISKGVHTFEWELGNFDFIRKNTSLKTISTLPSSRVGLPGRLLIADLNDDGRDEIFYVDLADPSQFYILFPDDSSKTFFKDPYPTGIPVPTDYTKDFINENGHISVFKGASSGFTNILVYDNSNPNDPTYRIYLAGIDYEGIFGTAGSFGIFPPPPAKGIPIFPPNQGNVIAEMADFDGDGLADLLFSKKDLNHMSYARFNIRGNLRRDFDHLIWPFTNDHYLLNLNGDPVTSILFNDSPSDNSVVDPRYAFAQPMNVAYNINIPFGLTLLLKDRFYVFANLNGSGLPCAFSPGLIINKEYPLNQVDGLSPDTILIYEQLGSQSSVSENIGGKIDKGSYGGFLKPIYFDIDFIKQAPFGHPSINKQNNPYGYPPLMPLIRVFDYDQDGCDELLFLSRLHYATGQVYVEKWNGAGMTEIIPKIAQGLNLSDEDDYSDVFEILDYSGSGLGDVLLHNDEGLVLFVRDGKKADLMTTIVDGFGAKTTIDYRPISDPKVHTPGFGFAYPQRSITSNIWVVSQYTESNGAGSNYEDDSVGMVNTFQFQYQGGVEDCSGDGFLGFTSRDVTHVEKNTSTHITYFPHYMGGFFYPLIGLPINETTSVLLTNNFKRIYSTQYEYKVRPHANKAPFFVFTSKQVDQESEYDNFGSPTMQIRVRTITQNMDDFGNILYHKEEWSDGNHSGYFATYLNDPSLWIIGRLLTIKESSTSQNGLKQAQFLAYEYDNKGLLVRIVIEPGAKGPTGYQPISQQKDGIKTLYRSIKRYANGNIHQVIDEETTTKIGVKRTLKFTYDNLEHIFITEIENDLAQHIRAIYHPGLGVLTKIEDENGIQISRSYDGFGRFRQEIVPDGNDTKVNYLNYSKFYNNQYRIWMRVVIVKSSGPVIKMDFDVLGRPFFETTQTRDDGAEVYREIVYDSFLRVGKVTRHRFGADPLVYNSHSYDNLDRIESIINTDATSFTNSYWGEWLIKTDANGNKVGYKFDNLNRVVFITEKEAALIGTRNPAVGMTFEYGPFNTLNMVTDSSGNHTKSRSDRLGRPIELIDPDRGHRSYEYNAFGDILKESKSNKQMLKYDYDAIGRLKQITDPVDGNIVMTWDKAPNGIGKLAKIDASNVIIDYEYDIIGRLSRKNWSIGSSSYSIGFTFDAVGRMSEFTYPQVGGSPAFAVKYAYGNYGQLLSVLDSSSNTPYWILLNSDASGQFFQELLGNGLVNKQNESLVRPGILKGIQTYDKAMTKIRDLTYGFDPNRNLQSRNDNVLNTSELFEYDNFNRLQSWTWNGKVGVRKLSWDYDDIGNILKRTVEAGPGTDLTYNYNTHIAGPHAVISTNLGNFTYDTKGNQITGPDRIVTFGRGDLPIQIKNLVGKQVDFTYDGEANRIRTSDTITNLVTDLIGEMYEYRRSKSQAAPNGMHTFNIIVNRKIIARKVWKVSNKKVTGEYVDYLHFDHQGSIDMVSNENGNVIERLKYDPYGKRVSINDPSRDWTTNILIPDIGYTAQIHLDGWGLVDMKGRFYDPLLGKFISADPLIPEFMNPQAWNKYAYVLNNPLTLIDPSGFDDKIPGEDDTSTNENPPLAPGVKEPVYLSTVRGGQRNRNDDGLPSRVDPIPASDGISRTITKESKKWIKQKLYDLEFYTRNVPSWKWGVGAGAIAFSGGILLAEGVAAGIIGGGAQLLGIGEVNATAVAASGLGISSIPLIIPRISQWASIFQNRLWGNAWRDVVANGIAEWGYVVETEVPHWTPFGWRFVDVVVKHPVTLQIIGFVETKAGTSSYTALQEIKDVWLSFVFQVPVFLQRYPLSYR